MTDLENHLETPGRSDQIKEVRKMFDAQGIADIYYQFASVTGRILDPTGAAVAGAKIRATKKSTNEVTTAASNAEGF